MNKSVCVIGLGHIGLPVACLLATLGFAVRGVDVNTTRLNEIKEGSLHTEEPNLKETIKKAHEGGNLQLSPEIGEADVYIIAVPTLLDKKKCADITRVDQVLKALTSYLKPSSLVIIESTCPVGTTDQAWDELKKSNVPFYLAYCPERTLPGNILDELVHNHRIVGGVNALSTDQAALFYESFLKGKVYKTTARTAEAVKLAENAYRDMNIAFANEMSMVADDLGIDIREWIALANHHPRVNILNPSVGVGGCCIPMDPWYLIQAVPEVTMMMRRAREVNTKKTEWVIEKVLDTVKQKNISRIACFGLTYKANVADTRESPALEIVERLEQEIHVLRVDPFVSGTTPIEKAIEEADLIIGLIPHHLFSLIPFEKLRSKKILDFGGCFTCSLS